MTPNIKSYCWLFQRKPGEETIDFTYTEDRELSGYILPAIFDISFHITNIFHNRADLENRLQILKDVDIKYTNEDDLIFFLFYTISSPEDFVLGHIQSAIIANKLNVICFKVF